METVVLATCQNNEVVVLLLMHGLTCSLEYCVVIVNAHQKKKVGFLFQSKCVIRE